MFDLTSSKLLILAVVALIVVGPKDLPALLRTVGYYLGMIRRQANEFRAQFEDAMRETELAELKKEVQQLGEETRSTFESATRAVETQLGDIDRSMSEIAKAEPVPLPPELAPAATPAIGTTDPGAVETAADAPPAAVPSPPEPTAASGPSPTPEPLPIPEPVRDTADAGAGTSAAPPRQGA
jgi:sec-independent protein translocase protein TatB